jgi:hypothetical protein
VANHNVRWEIGWEILNETCVRVFAGPNELIRTIDGLTQWQPMRSFWYEDVSNDSTSTNRGLSFLLHSITVSTHPSSTWPVGAYYETNGAAPYGALTFKGNRVLANSASVSNAPAGQQDVVRLRDLSSLTNGDFSILSAFGSDANPVDTRWTNLTGFKGYLVVATVLSVPAANDDAGLYMTNVTKNKVYFDGVFTSVLTPLGVQSTLRYRCGTNDVVHFKGATTGTGEMAISDSWFETD